MDDLEDFIASVRERAAAWQELEKKKKKSKKRKGDGKYGAQLDSCIISNSSSLDQSIRIHLRRQLNQGAIGFVHRSMACTND